MSQIQRCVLEIRPRKALVPYFERTARWSVIVAHRRFGKTYGTLQDMIAKAAQLQRPNKPGRYGYIAPTRDQAEDIAWTTLLDVIETIPGVVVNKSKLRVTLPNRSQIRLYSGENYERMRGLYFDGVVSDEDADIPANAFDYVIRACLADTKGWHTRIGTPKGRNAFHRAYLLAKKTPKRFCLFLPASVTGIIPQDELDDLKSELSPEAYAQELECDFGIGRPGAIYARAIDLARESGRVCDLPVDGGALVYTTWDIGAPANTSVIYWQQVGAHWRVIDHDSGSEWSQSGDATLTERVAHIAGKGYNFGGHILPHDADSQQPNGLSFRRELETAGLRNVRVIPRAVSGNRRDPTAAERRVNRMLELFPSIWFSDRCGFLLDALSDYHRKEEETSGRIMSRIVHDWTSHCADSFGYLGEALDAGILGAEQVKQAAAPARKIRVRRPEVGLSFRR